jgi:hypothetical protein
MSETKAFPTADVLSTITGRLMGDIGGVYRVLEYMAGHPVWTHQIPRVSREAQPVVIGAHPTLAQACEEAKQVTPDNYKVWLATWLDRYGPEIAVPRMTADDHENTDPLSELAEKVHPDRIVVV